MQQGVLPFGHMMRLFACLLIACIWGCPLATAQAQSRVVSVCYDATALRPWVNKLGVPLLQTSGSLQHIAFEQVPLPWLRCLRDVDKGVYAGAVGASYSEERAAFAVYPATADGQLDPSRRMLSSSYSLFRASGASGNWDGKKFMGLSSRVIAQRGYSVVADLNRMAIPVDQSAGDPETVFRMLMARRSQFGVMVTEQGEETMKLAEFQGQIEKVTPPLIVKDYYLIFGKRYYEDNKRLVEALWAQLSEVRDLRDAESQSRLKSRR